MSDDGKMIYDAMIEAGVEPDTARTQVKDLGFEDPVRLESARVEVNVRVTVKFDEWDLDAYDKDDEVNIISLATEKVENELQSLYDDLDIEVCWGDLIQVVEKG